MTRKWWFESAMYDDGMLEWGGENIEQSIRCWLCGGSIVVARDAHIGQDPFAVDVEDVQAEFRDVVAAMEPQEAVEDEAETIEAHLDRRTLKIKRRPGNAKPERIAAAAAELDAIRAKKRRKVSQ